MEAPLLQISVHRDLVTSSANGERITDATENLGKSLRDHEVRLEKLVEQVSNQNPSAPLSQ